MSDRAFEPKTGWFVITAAVLATSMAFIDATALVIAMPAIQKEFGSDAVQLMWITTIYAIPLTSLLLLGGSLGDRYGRMRLYVSGILLFTVAAFACGIAPNLNSLLVFRFAQGVGAAFMIPGSLALISETFPSHLRGRAIGTWSGLTVIATIGGPVIGGLMAGADLWRWIFFINLPIAAIALVLIRFKVPSRNNEISKVSLDWPGAIYAAVGLGAVSYALLEAPRMGFFSPIIIMTMILGLGALTAFVYWESRCRHPLLPLKLFHSRQLRAASLLTLFLYSAWNALLFFLPFNLIQVQAYPAAIAGLSQLPLMLALAVLSRPAGQLADRKGVHVPLIVGSSIAGVGFLLIALPGVTVGPSDFWVSYFPGLVVLGAGLGLTVAPLSTAIINAIPSQDAGLAAGINSTLARLAGLAGIALLGPLVLFWFNASLGDTAGSNAASLSIAGHSFGPLEGPDLQHAFVDSFRLLCYFSAGLSWAGTAIIALMHRPVPSISSQVQEGIS